MFDKIGTLFHSFSFWSKPMTSSGRAILIPAAAEAESAAKSPSIYNFDAMAILYICHFSLQAKSIG
jgi:hypothetical protein